MNDIETESEKTEPVRENILRDFLGIKSDHKEEDIDKIIQEKMNVSILNLKQAIFAQLIEYSEKISEDIVNIIPFGDYDKLIEEPKDIVRFLREESIKPEYWDLSYIEDVDGGILKFVFYCNMVDEGNTLKGFTFISKDGKIKHVFAQYSD